MATEWTAGEGEYTDIRYELSGDGIAKITIDRPQVRNAFRPQTIVEISQALERAREDTSVGVIVLTGEGELAFCSGGDQNVRGDTGYLMTPTPPTPSPAPSAASTSPTCTSRSAGCPSRSSRWWRASRSAAATSCISSAT